MAGRREDEEKITGGRFVQPAANNLLPPVREVRIQGGRFVQPAADNILPPVRSYRVQGVNMEPGADPPLHFGRAAGISSRISAITPGTCFLNTIKFYYPWNSSIEVTSVPVGERFDLTVNYQAINTTPELGVIAGFWSMCIVFWDDEGDIEGYYFKNTTITGSTSIANNSARIANAYTLTMPDHDVILHFNMFMNDDMSPDQQYPARASWGTLKT